MLIHFVIFKDWRKVKYVDYEMANIIWLVNNVQLISSSSRLRAFSDFRKAFKDGSLTSHPFKDSVFRFFIYFEFCIARKHSFN